MMVLVAIWGLLGVVVFCIGHAALSVFTCPKQLRRGDWILLSCWVGLVVLEWLALALSLGGPVSSQRFFPLVGVVALIALLAARRTLASRLKLLLSTKAVTALVLVLAAAGFVAAGLRPSPDTGEYHYPAIHWLAEYGTVKGASHILIRLGFVSSVWALDAPFDQLLPGEASAVVNGFVLVLIIGQIAIASARLATGTGTFGDRFLWAASLLLLGLGGAIGFFTTPTPDLSVMSLTIVVAWRMLAHDEGSGAPGDLVPLILASGAFLAKLSGLLLVPAAVLFAVVGQPPRRWGAATLLGALLMAPFLIVSTVTSGCLVLPVVASCLPLDWTLPTPSVVNSAREIWEYGRWGGPMPVGVAAWSWLPLWLARPLNIVVFWPFALSFVAYLAVYGGQLVRGERWVLALIVPSMIVVFSMAPDLRFNYGLFITPVALLATRLGPTMLTRLPKRFVAVWTGPLPTVAVLAATLCVGVTAIDLRHGNPPTVERLLWPRTVPFVPVTAYDGEGFSYVVPDAGPGCWRAQLPCANRPLQGVELREPDRGIAGGFRRRSGSAAGEEQ